MVDGSHLQLNLLRHSFSPAAPSFIANAAAILLLPVSTMSLTSMLDLSEVHGNIKTRLTLPPPELHVPDCAAKNSVYYRPNSLY